jgi:fluoride exporter
VNPADVLWVGLAGSVGAVARFAADASVRARLDTRVPVGTIAINVSGSLLLGILTGLVVFDHVASTVALVAGTGFCGGFTTFSTTSFETVRLLQEGRLREAGINVGVTVVGAVSAAAAGMALTSL